jgi:hypothetical protein
LLGESSHGKILNPLGEQKVSRTRLLKVSYPEFETIAHRIFLQLHYKILNVDSSTWKIALGNLTTRGERIRIPHTSVLGARFPGTYSMLQSQSSNSPLSKPMEKCHHPRVQIVARDEDSEFVECLECREVFEASEFKDMEIEAEPADEE